MKKACSLILSVLLLLCALPTVGISAEDATEESTFQSTDFTVDEAHKSTTRRFGRRGERLHIYSFGKRKNPHYDRSELSSGNPIL